MSDGFEWRGPHFYGTWGEDLYLAGQVVKRDGEDKWEAWAKGDPQGVFVSEAAARRRVERVVTGRRPVTRTRSALRDGQPPPALPAAGWTSAWFWARPPRES